MATKACKLICVVILFAFVTQGYGFCELKDLTIKQTKTGKMVKNKPEWEVRVTNPCMCEFVQTTMSCVGFKSVTTIDPFVMTKTGDNCLITSPVPDHADFVFKYVWDKSFNFKIISGTMACS